MAMAQHRITRRQQFGFVVLLMAVCQWRSSISAAFITKARGFKKT
jgi:hypothetical protein